MRVLPGAAGGEFALFAAGVSRMQQVLGEHFAPAQGGSAYTSPAVGRLVEWIGAMNEHGAATGQSSWGPTGFAILPSQAKAEALVAAARAAGMIDTALSVRIVSARNRGAMLTRHAAAVSDPAPNFL
jgi:predicted sugar kinase